MAIKGKKCDGRSSDLTFSWMLTTLGAEWQQWQELTADWMAAQTTSIHVKRDAIARFFESYLAECAPYAISNIDLFFKGYNGHLCSSEELEAVVKKTQNESAFVQNGVNYPCDFIDFVIEKVFTEEDDNGNLVPLVQNPLSKIKKQNSLPKPCAIPYRIATFRTCVKSSAHCLIKPN